MRALLVGICFAIWLSSSLVVASASYNDATIGSLLEVHETIVVALEQISAKPDTPRHHRGKKRLLSTLERGSGKWGPQHPRHRLLDALHGFVKYHERQKAELDRLKGLYKHVSKSQKAVLESHVQYSAKFSRIDELLAKNQGLCDGIVHNALEFYEIDMEELQKHVKDTEAAGKKAESISVSQGPKHFVRDWTDAGRHERDKPFSCILKTPDQTFPSRDSAAESIKVLLPGAGLGRLGHDIAGLGGFDVTINEWSMYMNIAYRFLEANRSPLMQTVHPFIDGWSHHATEADMYRALQFPDTSINASSVLLVEGDFTTVFKGQKGTYNNAIVTCFFVDTARNLMSYLGTIKKLLKPGGYWINLGPLLYGTGPFVQLSLEEILIVTEAMGFEYVDTDEQCGSLTVPGRKARGMEAIYGFDEKALTKNAYNAQFWVAKLLYDFGIYCNLKPWLDPRPWVNNNCRQTT